MKEYRLNSLPEVHVPQVVAYMRAKMSADTISTSFKEIFPSLPDKGVEKLRLGDYRIEGEAIIVTLDVPESRWYLGGSKGIWTEAFLYHTQPTPQTHSHHSHVLGPFYTERGAQFALVNQRSTTLLTVMDFERAAAKKIGLQILRGEVFLSGKQGNKDRVVFEANATENGKLDTAVTAITFDFSGPEDLVSEGVTAEIYALVNVRTKVATFFAEVDD